MQGIKGNFYRLFVVVLRYRTLRNIFISNCDKHLNYSIRIPNNKNRTPFSFSLNLINTCLRMIFKYGFICLLLAFSKIAFKVPIFMIFFKTDLPLEKNETALDS